MASLNSNKFKLKLNHFGKIHEDVYAQYFVFKTGDGNVLQINTYSSEEKARANQASQIIQINKQVAQKLVEIFEKNEMLK